MTRVSAPPTAATPQEIVERALALSTADACTVILDEVTAAHLRWANNELTTNGVVRHRLLTVIAFVGRGGGTAVGTLAHSGPGLDGLDALVRAAERAACSAQIADDEEPPVGPTRASEHWYEPPADTGVDALAPLAPDLRHLFGRARRDRRLLFGYAQHSAQTCFLATSGGTRLRDDRALGYVEVTARSADHGASVWAARPVADFDALDLAGLSRELDQRVGWTRQRVALPPGRYETVLPPSAVADLMVPMYFAAGARDAHDGRTAFSAAGRGTAVGRELGRSDVTLTSDPRAPGLECAPFVVARTSHGAASVFDNGLPLEETAWIRDGRLAALVQTRRSARVTGLPLTPYIDNLIMTGPPSGRTADDLIAGTRRGLLLTSLWYVREVDAQTLLLTGLTRDGVFLIDDGEVVASVNNFRFNDSPVGLLERILEVGRTDRTIAREWRDEGPRAAMPALRVADFNMSSVSPAS